MLAEARGADAAQAEIDGTKAAQKEIDKLRGEKPATPQIEIEADIEKVLAIRDGDAISERVTAAETQRAAYETSVAENGRIAVAALASDFPELASLPLDQWEFALRQMHAQQPQRFQHAMNRIQTVAQLEHAHNSLRADKTAREAAEFQTYAQAEDARFTSMTRADQHNMPAISE